MPQSSIAIVIQAYNEAGNLPGTLTEIVPILENSFKDYEVLIVNDCSKDETGKIADAAAAKNTRIKVIHNAKNMGLGYNYKTGVKMASKDYVMMIPGDNAFTKPSYEAAFKAIDQGKDIVIPYTANLEIRPKSRQIISRTYTRMMNLLFGLHLTYFNGCVIHKRSVIQSVEIKTDGFSYQAEALIKLLRKGMTYVEVPMYLHPEERIYGKSHALGPRNVARVCKAILSLWCEVHKK